LRQKVVIGGTNHQGVKRQRKTGKWERFDWRFESLKVGYIEAARKEKAKTCWRGPLVLQIQGFIVKRQCCPLSTIYK